MSMSMPERRGDSYGGGGLGGGAYGASSNLGGVGSYGGHYDEPYQIKPYKPSKSRSWDMGMQDPEMKRRKRVASYKVYTVEGKVKSTVRSSWRWIKNKYIDMRYGWW